MTNNKKNKQQQGKRQTVLDKGFSPWIPVIILVTAFAAWSYFVIKNYFRQNPVIFENLSVFLSSDRFPAGSFSSFLVVVSDDIISALVVFIILLAAFGIGDIIRKKMFENEDVSVVISIGLGITAIILIMLLIGLAGLLYASIFYLLFISMAALGIFRWRGFIKSPAQKNRPKKSDTGFFTIVYVLIIFAAAFVALFGALPPETFYDTLMYHLGVPLQWIQEHRIHNVHTIMQSYYPLNSHVLYTATLLLKDEKSAKLLNWAFAILTVWAIYLFGKKYFSTRSGIFAGATFLSTPMVILVASRICVELPLAFFETLCFFSFVNWYDTHKNRWCYLSAVFLSMALGSKYTSASCMISIFVVLAAVFIIEKNSLIDFIRKSVLYILIVFAIMSPWFIKNYFDVGNPIHPFKFSATKGVAQTSKGKTVDYIDQNSKFTSPLHFVTVPWRVTMTNEFQESFSGAAFLYLAPLVFLFRNNSKYAKLLAVYAIPYYLI
ncbi:MAG: glycosyltransferase family 39 protein, partial [Elusimicrobiota bacterium]